MLRPSSAFALSRAVRVLLSAGLAVLAASALMAYDAVSSRSPTVSVAGEAKMQMLRDEHAQIAAYIASTNEARKLAEAAVDRDIAQLRLAAHGKGRQLARVAEAEAAKAATKVESKPDQKTIALRTPERAPAVRMASRDLTVAEPLPLAQVANVTVTPAARAVQVRYTDGPVRSRLRQLATDVRSLPSWLHAAADWVVEAVPTPKLPLLPLLPARHLRAEI